MKATLHMLACCTLLTTTTTSAQQFVNGGFEPKATITACTDVAVATYNANMGGNRAIGTNTTMQIANSSCSQGTAQQGSYFGVMKYMPGSSAVISFKLDKPMTIGTEYKVALSYKAAAGSDPGVMCSFRYGYGSDSTKADSFVSTSKQITATVWTKDTLKITPKKASQFVWIEVAVLGGDPYTVHVDDVNMLGMATGVESVAMNKGMHITPNPTYDRAMIVLDETIVKPYSMEVKDIMGGTVLKKEKENGNTINVGKTELGSGMFFINVVDNKQQVFTSRLLIN